MYMYMHTCILMKVFCGFLKPIFNECGFQLCLLNITLFANLIVHFYKIIQYDQHTSTVMIHVIIIDLINKCTSMYMYMYYVNYYYYPIYIVLCYVIYY